jgi:amino-acid N-acetyltransferase
VQGDLRAVLRYVPSFRGKVFVVVLDARRMPELALAEALLDLLALQQVGVRLVVVSTGSGEARIDQLLIDGELKWQAVAMEVGAVQTILNRGQLALVECPDLEVLGDPLVTFAASLGAFKLIVLGPGPVAGGNALSREAAAEWRGEDASLLRRAAEVCRSGIPRVHLLNETHQGVLMDELFSNEGVGVMVFADDYLSVRPIAPDDIPELLAMVGRSMRDAHLVPRSYEEIENLFEDFLVMTIDGNVVGCVALHVSQEPRCGEVACLYVKQSHGGEGYGRRLVSAAEERARHLGLPWVFALSTRAVGFFTEKLGYEACPITEIPEPRRRRLEESGRDSLVIRKRL